MKRRDFLRVLALGTALGWSGPAMGYGASSGTRTTYRVKPFALDELTLLDLRRLMEQRKETAVSLAKKYLSRIKALDQRGPKLNAILELNPDALVTAAELDRERALKGSRGPLHGIPILIKGNIDTHDRMTTTAGSLALKGSIPPRDAFLVARLRGAGAVLLGKTNLSEWANFRGSLSSSGWSAQGGQTRNPYCLDRNPSGSSSGSAVAVSANLCGVAVGTETDGSILSPSSFCGIVGIKPTLGLISRSGIIPIAHSQDTAGPMARTVSDAATLLGILAGSDSADAATAQSTAKAAPDYTRFLDAKGLAGARLGVARNFFGFHPAVDRLMEGVLAGLKRAGAEVVDSVPVPKPPELDSAELEVLRYEMKADMNAYLATLGPGAPVHSLKEIIEFNEQHRAVEMRWFGQEELLKAEAKGPLTERAYRDALFTSRRLARTEGIDAALAEHHLDALVAPTSTPAHLIDWVLGDHGLGDSTTPAAVAGYPSITVPAGQVHSLPVGVSFFAEAWSEPKLIRLAYAFEQASKSRRPPEFLQSVNE